MACHGGDNLFIRKFEEICIEKSPNNIINDANFVFPARKKPGISSTTVRLNFILMMYSVVSNQALRIHFLF